MHLSLQGKLIRVLAEVVYPLGEGDEDIVTVLARPRLRAAADDLLRVGHDLALDLATRGVLALGVGDHEVSVCCGYGQLRVHKHQWQPIWKGLKYD